MPDGLRLRKKSLGTIRPTAERAPITPAPLREMPQIPWGGEQRTWDIPVKDERGKIIGLAGPDNIVRAGGEEIGTYDPTTGQYTPKYKGAWGELGSQLWGKVKEIPSLPFKALGAFEEYVAKPFGTLAAAPFTPAVEGTEGMGWWERERKEYEEWEEPILFTTPWGYEVKPTKGLLELIPWLAIPPAAKVAGLLGKAGLLGRAAATALKPAVIAEQVMGKAITAPLKLAGKGVKKLLVKPSELMPDLQDFNQVIEIATQPDNMRKLANLPFIKPIARLIGGRAAVANTPVDKALVGRAMIRHEGNMKALGAVSSVRPSEKVFKLAADGTIASGKLKGVTPNTIATYLDKYTGSLTKEQKLWAEEVRKVSRGVTELLKRSGIDIKELGFDEGGEWIGRRVFAKFTPEGELLDYAFIGAGPGRRPGAKVAFEKGRIFKTQEEAVKQGYRYLAQEEALYLNAVGAYNRVADKQMSDWLLERIPWRRTAVGGELAGQRELLQGQRSALKQMSSIIEHVETAKPFAPQLWKGIKRYYPEEYTQLRRTLIPKTKIEIPPRFRIDKQVTERRIAEVKSLLSQEGKLPKGLPTKDELRKELASLNAQLDLGSTIKGTDDMLILIERIEAKIEGLESELGIRSIPYRGGEKAALYVGWTTKQLDEMWKVYKSFQEALIKGEIAPSEKPLLTNLKELIVNEKDELAKAFKEMRSPYKKARERAMRPSLGEATVQAPAFAGKILTGSEAKETARILRAEFEPQFSKALHAVNQVNAVGRYFMLAGDISPATIQLIFMAGSNPRVYGKALKGFVRAMFDTEFHSRYLAKHLPTIQSSPGLVLTKGGVTEFTEAMARGGLLRKGPFKIAGKVLEPFQRGFETALDVAGIELKEAYSYLATTPARNAQVDAFVNEFRGLLATARIGVSTGQRQLERASVLAPQYNRAIAALLGDVFRGNLRGELARKSLAKGVAAIMAMTVAVSYALGENEEDIAEHLNPNSPRFMTWEIGGQNIGPGSKVRSLLKTWAQSAKDPENLFETSMENPALRFVRGNLAPTVSTGLDLITGKNYIGDPSREGLLSIGREGKVTGALSTVLAENLLPIWVQTALLEGGDIESRALRGAGEFLGLRTYPQPDWEVIKDLKEKLAQKDFGKPFEELNLEEKDKLLEAHPDYRLLTEEAKDRMVYEKGEDYEQWLLDAEKISDAVYISRVEVVAQSVMTGQLSLREFYDWESSARMIYKGNKMTIDYIGKRADPDAQKEFLRYLEEQAPEDKALSEYWDIGRKPYTDPTGLKDWGRIEKEQDTFLASLDAETREYVERNKNRWVKNIPPTITRTLIEIQVQGRDVVDEYYDQPEGKERLAYRRANPTVDAWLLVMGRVSVPQTPMAMQTALRILREKGLPERMLVGIAGIGGVTGAETLTPQPSVPFRLGRKEDLVRLMRKR